MIDKYMTDELCGLKCALVGIWLDREGYEMNTRYE